MQDKLKLTTVKEITDKSVSDFFTDRIVSLLIILLFTAKICLLCHILLTDLPSVKSFQDKNIVYNPFTLYLLSVYTQCLLSMIE
ncbi:hypothetical protein N42_1701 [Lactococcus lactis subsp. lactis]|uniref:Uncharacterized protein n=1 Tax=Lactococcus lactis subsp. lactis TaxID=1360 RepID=A0A0V8EKT7_LACLL|nr:hypothetical protein N42_1701 [Lactococcus lactis subsp. lactis]